MEYLFREVQRFNFKIIWGIIILVSGIMIYTFIDQVAGSFHNNPAPDIVVLIFTPIISVGFPLFFYFLRMETTVTAAEIKINYIPLSAVIYSIEEIEKISAREYSPLNEFGGWGIKSGFKIKCYTMSGKEGVEIKLKSGQRILIGTRYKDELYGAIYKQLNTKVHIPEIR